MSTSRCLWVIAAMIVFAVALPAIGQNNDQEKPKPKKANVFTDPADAPIDYKIQGEYVGENNKLAAQVVARGNGKFDVYILQGGLPGAGWDPKAKKVKLEAKLDADNGIATFMGGGYNKGSQIDAAKKTLVLATDDPIFIELKRVERKSPTLDAKPPEDAIVLFDGKNADAWSEKKMAGDLLGVPNTSKRKFTDFKLHLEFRTPFQPSAGGQGRGNSGVYLQNRYEIQVLDSFGLKGENNECGAIYSVRAPTVNMCLPPLVWQTYDVEYRTGKVDPDTKKQSGPFVTVIHNGVKVHDHFDLKGSGAAGPIHLQNHGDPVVYRNVWVVELK
jgi:hypothetical protein